MTKESISFSEKFARFVELVMVTLTVFMVLLVSYQVFERYVLHYTPPWSEELAVYLMIWFGVIGIAVGVWRDTHMSLHYFADKMPAKVQRVLLLFKYVLMLVYSGVITYQGFEMVKLTISQKSPAMGLPVGYVYLVLPISMVLIVIFTLEKFYEDFLKGGKK